MQIGGDAKWLQQLGYKDDTLSFSKNQVDENKHTTPIPAPVSFPRADILKDGKKQLVLSYEHSNHFAINLTKYVQIRLHVVWKKIRAGPTE